MIPFNSRRFFILELRFTSEHVIPDFMDEQNILITWPELGLLTLAAAVFSWLGIVLLLPWLKRSKLYDTPNERSNHKAPIPRGGGIAVVLAFLLTSSVFLNKVGMLTILWPVLLAMFSLMIVSWIDDLRNGLSPVIRLLAQIIAVGTILAFPHPPLFGGLFPIWVDSFVVGFIWVGFINLYNFMDGIDGITGVETITIGLGAFLISLVTEFPVELGIVALLIACCSAGFLIKNWHPAAIFLGDVGSIPLGFCTGWILLSLALSGEWVAALILPGYYLLDGGITLLWRIIKREKFWQAHSQHCYQRAVRGGKSHSAVSFLIAGVNLLLMALALSSVYYPDSGWYLLGISLLIILPLLGYFARHESAAKH